MASALEPICPQHTSCKCCSATASLYGVVDFHKNCEILRRKVLEPSGIPIYYYRCPECQLIFTTAFDHFSKEDFSEYIYNSDYILVDPDYREARPRGTAALVQRLFSVVKPAHILDYGGGSGYVAELLRAAGFPHVDTYDPFVPEHATKPSGRYECILSFEVVEHSPHPIATFTEMSSLLAGRGIILFSTLLQPLDIDNQGVNWWYVGPRNGHVTLYTRPSLLKVVQPLGFQLRSASAACHLLFRELPEFARHLVE